MKLKTIVAALALVTSGVAVADSYKAEVGAKVFREANDDVNDKYNVYGAYGKYYFNPVQTDNLPLAEAAYLGKNSDVFATALHFPDGYFGPSSGNSVSVGAEFFIPESFLYISGGVSRTKFKGYTDDDWFTTVGITPIDGLLVTTSYSHDEGYDANVHAKYVTDIGGGHFINLEAGVADNDDGTYKEIGGDFYFDNTFSVGGVIASQDSDNEYTVRARKFFTERFSGQASFTDYEEGNAVMAGVDFRF